MWKRSFLRNILVRVFLICVSILALRFAYVVTTRGEACDSAGDFCFFSVPDTFNVVTNTVSSSASAVITNSVNASPATPSKIWTTVSFQNTVKFYVSVFEDLLTESVLKNNFKTLCVESDTDTDTGAGVLALKELGVEDSIGISKKGLKQFGDEVFDFVFCGNGVVEKSLKPGELAVEIDRTLKPEGFLVVHTLSKDTYSFESLTSLFNFCSVVKSRDIDRFDSSGTVIREVVFRKFGGKIENGNADSMSGKCVVRSYKHDLIRMAEALIENEPLKPWITLKKNAKTIKYLPSMVDISFKTRYVYVDVGARSYGSSIVSWFKKQYPKQNKTFDIYAIEADKTFHDQYKSKKGVTLLPYAAWVKNESLFFEINSDPGKKDAVKGQGMGRIKPVKSSGGFTSTGAVNEIRGFDFADWLMNTVTEKDYVVMKMDIEGTEFDIIPRLIETGAICLIDELFLECHYNRWQRCCPGERSTKYEKTYGQCLDLFTSLRDSGVLVHQWW